MSLLHIIIIIIIIISCMFIMKVARAPSGALGALVAQRADALDAHIGASLASHLGAKDSTPEIDTSEIIVDFQWHFPMDFQWHAPTTFQISVVFSKGLSRSTYRCKPDAR